MNCTNNCDIEENTENLERRKLGKRRKTKTRQNN